MEHFSQGQNYDSLPNNPNLYSTPINITGKKVGTMNTIVVTDNSQKTSNKLVLFAMSNGYNRKLLMLLIITVITLLTSYATIMALGELALSEALISGTFTGVFAYVGVGQFKEFRLLQQSKILDANIELIKRQKVIKEGNFEASLLELQSSATRNSEERSLLFREFTRRGDVIDVPILEQTNPLFASEKEVEADLKNQRLLDPEIVLLKDGHIQIELEYKPTDIESIKKLQRTYQSRLLKRENETDRLALTRCCNILNRYIRMTNGIVREQPQVVVVEQEVQEIGKRDGNYFFDEDQKKWWTCVIHNSKIWKAMGQDKAKIKDFISLTKLAISKKNKKPDPEKYGVEFFETVIPVDTKAMQVLEQIS